MIGVEPATPVTTSNYFKTTATVKTIEVYIKQADNHQRKLKAESGTKPTLAAPKLRLCVQTSAHRPQ